MKTPATIKKSVKPRKLTWDPEVKTEEFWLNDLKSCRVMGVCWIDEDGRTEQRFDLDNTWLAELIIKAQQQRIDDLIELHKYVPPIIDKTSPGYRLRRQGLTIKRNR